MRAVAQGSSLQATSAHSLHKAARTLQVEEPRVPQAGLEPAASDCHESRRRAPPGSSRARASATLAVENAAAVNAVRSHLGPRE